MLVRPPATCQPQITTTTLTCPETHRRHAEEGGEPRGAQGRAGEVAAEDGAASGGRPAGRAHRRRARGAAEGAEGPPRRPAPVQGADRGVPASDAEDDRGQAARGHREVQEGGFVGWCCCRVFSFLVAKACWLNFQCAFGNVFIYS